MDFSKMGSDELLVLWRASDCAAERAEILHHMEDAEVEIGTMALNGMPFPGMTIGGGRGPSLKVPEADMSSLNADRLKEFNEFDIEATIITNKLKHNKIGHEESILTHGSLYNNPLGSGGYAGVVSVALYFFIICFGLVHDLDFPHIGSLVVWVPT